MNEDTALRHVLHAASQHLTNVIEADTDEEEERDKFVSFLSRSIEVIEEARVERRNSLYEKCADCHLFVEPNDAPLNEGIATHIHLHRGDDADNEIDESHEAKPSGMKATLTTWKAYGPQTMKERFVV